MQNKCIAIIPARGGSKRIPRKNIKHFLGKPIIAYSIEAAINSGLFDEVMVSTDDDEIAGIAIQYGASIPFLRSKKNADDYASTMDVINEVLDSYKEELNKQFQFVCCIYPAAPLIKASYLKVGFEKMNIENLACVFPVLPYSYPIWRGIEIDSNGSTKMIWPEFLNSRSQDLKKVFHDAGQWYWFNNELLQGWIWPDNSGAIILSEEEAQDIDNISDWEIAEMKYKLTQKIQNS